MFRKHLVVSVSGGRSSATSAILVNKFRRKYKYRSRTFVFANTGQERIETINFLRDLEQYLGEPIYKLEGNYSGKKIGYNIIDNWSDLSMNSEPFTGAIKWANRFTDVGVPCQPVPYCSDLMKKRVIRKFAKEHLGTVKYAQVIGFRKEDMPKRITKAELDNNDGAVISPLITHYKHPWGQKELDRFWRNMPFKLVLPSRYGNCTLCWKKSDKNLYETISMGIAQQHYDWYRAMEQQFGNKFFRNRRSIDDIINEASTAINASDIGESCFCGS